MARVKKDSPKTTTKKSRPALTPEARENQLIMLATDLIEQRLRDGTASSQETTTLLKLATTKTRLENEKLKLERDLIKAKTEALQSNARIEEMYTKAINAMREYGGHGGVEDEYDY